MYLNTGSVYCSTRREVPPHLNTTEDPPLCLNLTLKKAVKSFILLKLQSYQHLRHLEPVATELPQLPAVSHMIATCDCHVTAHAHTHALPCTYRAMEKETIEHNL